MRSRNDLPGSWVISTTIRSDSTLVPPVTAERSPPASRITGADSPVIADSSTEAIPSITVPSPGIALPRLDHDDVAADELGGGLLAAVAQLRGRLRPHRPQARRLGAPASLRQRLGEVGEDDGQPEPDGDAEGEPGGLVAAAERAAAEELDQPGDGGDEGADLDHEHDRVAHLDPRVELAHRLDQRPGGGSRDRTASVPASRWSSVRCLLVEGDVELEHVDAGLAQQAEEATVGVRRDQVFDPGERELANGGDPVRLDPRVGLRRYADRPPKPTGSPHPPGPWAFG